MGALSSLTGGGGLSGSGGAATSTSGDSKGGNAQAGGISSPIVIGGFKSNGDATATNSNTIWLVVAGVVALGAVLYALWGRKR